MCIRDRPWTWTWRHAQVAVLCLCLSLVTVATLWSSATCTSCCTVPLSLSCHSCHTVIEVLLLAQCTQLLYCVIVFQAVAIRWFFFPLSGFYFICFIYFIYWYIHVLLTCILGGLLYTYTALSMLVVRALSRSLLDINKTFARQFHNNFRPCFITYLAAQYCGKNIVFQVQ